MLAPRGKKDGELVLSGHRGPDLPDDEVPEMAGVTAAQHATVLNATELNLNKVNVANLT